MNRYQKPVVYEQLAMEYSLGTLHGRARKRFEGLMKQHPYLEAIVEDNDRKFAGLVEFLPEIKPDDSVWVNINSRINESERAISQSTHAPKASSGYTPATQTVAGSWWQFLSSKGLAAAMVLLLISAVFLLKPWDGSGSEIDGAGYSAILVSEATNKPMVEVLVKKSDLMLTIVIKEPVPMPEGMKAVFWCIAKDKSTPIMNMGVVASHGLTTKQLGQDGWQGIVDASEFALSIEPAEATSNSSPSGELIFVGKLKALTKT